jgi:hypothetical protein
MRAAGAAGRSITVKLLAVSARPGRRHPGTGSVAWYGPTDRLGLPAGRQGIGNALASYPELGCADSALAAAVGADLVVLPTAWPEFPQADPAEIAQVAQGAAPSRRPRTTPTGG